MKDTIASGIQTPREVDLLLVGKEAPIEPTDLQVSTTSYDETCPRGPEDLRHSSILSLVIL